MGEPLPESTADLVRLAQGGDREALDELVVRCHPRLLERIRLMMGPGARRVAESADFLQGVLTEAVRALPDGKLRDERRLLHWLTGIARNKIREATRKRREQALESLSVSLHGDGRDDGPATAAEIKEKLERLVDALEQLDEDYRRVIELRALEGLPLRQIGVEMDRSEDAARMLYHRATIQLGRILGDDED